jgi:general nucleoside transport system permease protein
VRQPTSQWAQGPAIPVISVLVALILAAIFVLISGNNPLLAYLALIRGAFGSPYDIT